MGFKSNEVNFTEILVTMYNEKEIKIRVQLKSYIRIFETTLWKLDLVYISKRKRQRLKCYIENECVDRKAVCYSMCYT